MKSRSSVYFLGADQKVRNWAGGKAVLIEIDRGILQNVTGLEQVSKTNKIGYIRELSIMTMMENKFLVGEMVLLVGY
jgi:hypothetical protein